MYTVYILHFDQPYWKNCRHYIGYTSLSLGERLERHRAGNGSKLVNYALRVKGCDFTPSVVSKFATQEEARAMELKIKKSCHADRYCRFCERLKRLENLPKGTETTHCFIHCIEHLSTEDCPKCIDEKLRGFERKLVGVAK